jgi:hypothetical protein
MIKKVGKLMGINIYTCDDIKENLIYLVNNNWIKDVLETQDLLNNIFKGEINGQNVSKN